MLVGLDPGNYRIVNEEKTSDGDELAVEYNGKGSYLWVAKRHNGPNQVWSITGGAGAPQSIAPFPAAVLHNQPAANYVLPGETPYQWHIFGIGGIYVVQSHNWTLFWGLHVTEEGETVTLSTIHGHHPAGGKSQNWRFIKAD